MIGCGNSDFSTNLYLKGGYENILNIDYSDIVIQEMRLKNRSKCPKMRWEVGDVLQLTSMGELIDNFTYDVILDKGK